MSVNIGSFGAILTGDQTVPDDVWTKIVFDEADWDTGRRFDLRAGYFKAERDGKYSFVVGARLLIPTAAWCGADLMLYMNDEPLCDLTPNAPLKENCYRVALNSRSTPQALLVRGFTIRGVNAETGDVFEIYIRQDCGQAAYLSPRHGDGAHQVGGASSYLLYGSVACVSDRHSLMQPTGSVDESDYLDCNSSCLRC